MSQPRYQLQLWHCLSVAEIDAWAAGAAVGDELDYAGGTMSPVAAHPGWRRARALFEARRVVMLSSKQDGVWRFWLRRLADPAGAPSGPQLNAADRAVLAYVKERQGAALPTNDEMAWAARVRNGKQAGAALRKLERLGLVRVERARGLHVWDRRAWLVADGGAG